MITKRDLKYIGAALYWGEGTKERELKRGGKIYAVEFTNVNVKMICIFLKFLREVVRAEEDRIKAQVFLYPDHVTEVVLDYWSKCTKIPRNRFQKVILLKQGSGKYKPSMYGIMKIRYSHKEHFLKIRGIIDEIAGGVG